VTWLVAFAAVTPVVAAVMMPLGSLEPSPRPSVNLVLVMRPSRVTIRWRTNASMSTWLSCNSSNGTAMILLENL
jgi:hypothetical protein